MYNGGTLMNTLHLSLIVLFALCISSSRVWAADAVAKPEPIALWPGIAPGEKGDIGEERDTTKPDPKISPDKYITRLGNVSKPTLTVYRPPADKETGTAVVVCPGGGYSILAYY